ncbi:MAG: hypothetical protein SOZ62_01795 [Eubacteriales bacterium]|nr:hypothetical protein [Eubacteriales bacterium]
MVKGYRRNAVLMKNTGSDMFETAYFILKDDYIGSETDIICEANRILEENTHPGRRKLMSALPLALSFLFGAGVCALIMSIILL